MIRRLSLITLFIFVTGSTWWLVSTLEYTSLTNIVKSKSKFSGPNHYMIDFTATSMDQSGLPKHELSAPHMAHYPSDNRTELKKPNFTFHQKSTTRTWNINADWGTVLNNGDKVVLTGNVVIKADAKNNGPIIITTEELFIMPNDNFAETEKPVQINRDTNQVNAVGAKFYLDNEILKLVSKVRGKYEPRS